MTQDGTTPPRRIGGLAIALIVFASLGVNGVLLWKWFGTKEQPGPPAVSAAPETDRAVGRPPSAPSAL